MPSLSRAILVCLTARAAVAAGYGRTDRERLLDVASRTDSVATRAYCIDGVGCPLEQSGVFTLAQASGQAPATDGEMEQSTVFFSEFDKRVSDHVYGAPTVPHIIKVI